ncbi:MAG: WYL domain-containing protein [Lachnospiraceae bacterium]|nr:WYL domain-containing protein [Lachnospiraceae bacterium]
MAKSENQKLKLIYLMDKFLKDTDEEHGITMQDILSYLDSNDIKAERKSIYDDIETLRFYGFDIIMEKKDRKAYYKLASRDFELAELKVLVDLVQVSKFLTPNKTNQLIKKLEALTSKYEAVELQRQVHVINRVKNPNEKIYLLVDKLHDAIHKSVQVEFQYANWNLKKELMPKHDGKTYKVSPWALTWDDENYYLIGYDEEETKIKHFRVDKIQSLEVKEEERHGKELFEKFDPATYSKKTFGMYGGDEKRVKLKVDNSLVGVIIDRFGTDIMIIPDNANDCFTVNVDVAISNQFIGWLIGLGDGVEVMAPESLRSDIKDIAHNIIKKYQ